MKKRHLLIVLFLWLLFDYSTAQFGKLGSQTISIPSIVLNQYAVLQTNASVGNTQITVTNVADLNNPQPLERGDLLLIIQMQGASIDNSNSINYGNITAYNGAGNYEFVYVTQVVGNVISLSCPLRYNYTTAGRTQVVRVPQYQNLTISAGSTVTAPAWNGTRGGIVAIYAQNLQHNGIINVSALGFRGGALENSTANNQTIYFSPNATAGAEKGESIAGYQTEYTALGGRFGRGAPANGGGGGNGNNGGGGGGANGGVPANWFRGAGVMCSACTGSAAWSLDPDYIANGNALTNSSGGGRGGYTTSTSNQNALTLAPGSAAWASDNRRPHGGLGGRPLTINPENRVFLGGGGGAGDQNNNAGGRGGNGGGIIFIIANQITGNGQILANGENGANTTATHADGAGGGGGGGTVVIKATNVSNLTIQARGGNGGNQLITTNQAQGPGGGGGGGVIAVLATSDLSVKNVSGGVNGTTTSAALTEFPANGATSGNTGSLFSATPVFILACNLPPSLQNDNFTTAEDMPLSGSVVGNDSDLESLTLTYQAGTFSTSQGGTIVINTNGTFTYTPPLNFNGTDTYTYTACDNGQPTNQCATAVITIQVLPVNDAPIAQNDSFTTNEDSILSGNVSLNDNDGDPETTQTLTYTLVSGGTATANGTLVLNTNGTFTYTPNLNFNGVVSFTYQVCDNGSPVLCATATATITINPVNDTPTAVNDSFTTNEDNVLSGDVSLNDNDGDPETTQTLTYTLVSGGTASANGTLVLNADGTFTYTPNLNFNGVVSFTYQVCDNGSPVLCTTATATITINPVNDAPVAVNDSFTTPANTLLSGNVALNDSDEDNTSAELTFSLVNPSSAGANGTLVFNPNGSFTYQPNPNFTGIVTFVYQVCDTHNACSQALVTINVQSQPPVASADSFMMDEDNSLQGNILTNDSDPDSPLNELSCSLLSGGTAVQNGKLTLLPNGNFTYIPNANFNGVVQFTYKVCDLQNNCSQANVSITIRPINDAPVAQNDEFTTTQSQPFSGTLVSNDSDIDGDQLTYQSGTFTTASQGTIKIEPNGTFTYTPAYAFAGTDCFEYTLCDMQNACSKANVCIVVNGSDRIFIPEAFSPNGDGLYDSFKIEGIEGKKVSVKIYNRWGNLVYQNENYRNDWNGTANIGLHAGENLPDGTYFYVIDFNDGSKSVSNYLVIKR
ncbi:Ig-like domain-containing protein [Raineya orbicola]|uniref:Gliding motility-associated C-terminal domain n=1 Tax=Raineya orbicola TaxID=2016530 RepID=A0A2N3IE98_9BACT|nr:Ig-like domain-containing protein [Raineya orbicola]PKQ68605.1 Gliding motility-associated C-terminal domain [Raineya orbicola]